MSFAEIHTDIRPYFPDVITVVPVLEGDTPTPLVDDLGIDAERMRALGVTGAAGQGTRILVLGATTTVVPVLLIGLGKERTEEALRRAAGVAARMLKDAPRVVYDLAAAGGGEVEALLLGHILGGYRYDRFSSQEATEQQVAVAGADADTVARATALAGAVCSTRDLVNTPPSALTPEDFADVATSTFAQVDAVTVEVWDEQRLVAEGCGGVLGVGAGSANPPRIVRLEYAPQDARAHVALVGKGITFDSGGLSIKPAASMVGMKFDMSGAAAVLGTVRAAAALGLPVRVTGWCMLAENMPSGSAIKPDDVLVSRSGTTIEVTNTDAEGRLVLADGLALASEQHPDVVIDIATLTGAQVVALGERTIGVMGNSDEWRDRVLAAAAAAGEPAWAMPIPEELDEKLKSPVADVVNSKPGDRAAGMLFAAAFLRRFVGIDEQDAPLPWVHLDIAGPAEAKSEYGYIAAGATGVPVRTLVGLLSSLS